MEARAEGYEEKRNNSYGLGSKRSRDAFCRNGDFKVHIKGRARVSLAKS